MVDDIGFQKLMDASFRLVSFRPRSKKELHDALMSTCKKRHIHDVSVIDAVLTRLTELGYVDDRKFATWWIDQRNQFRPKGWRALSFELMQKGVDRALIEALKTENAKGEAKNQDEEHAGMLAKKVFPKWEKLPIKEQKMKLYAYLSRRGFEGASVMRVVDAMMGKGYNSDTT